jgi:cytochrome P450
VNLRSEQSNIYPGLPHQLVEEDNYRGYIVPEGTTVLANTWYVCRTSPHRGSKIISLWYSRAMTRNEAMYPSPNTFDPERFFGPDKVASEACQQVEAVFGFGRRICPGRFFAQSSIWMLMTNMIATMNISKAVDEKGREINITGEYFGSVGR